MKRILLAIIILILLLTACANNKETQAKANNQTQEQQTTNTQVTATIKTIEVRLTNNEMFEPNTITVNQGDNVKLQFMSANVFTFSIPEYSISEKVSSNYLEFTASKKGTYIFECTDCKEQNTGLLIVK